MNNNKISSTRPSGPKSLSDTQQLETILYQFVMLYERWAEDRQAGLQHSTQFMKGVDAFLAEVERFSQLEATVKKALTKTLRDSLMQASEELGESIQQSVEKIQRAFTDTTQHLMASQLESLITPLSYAVQQAQTALNDYKTKETFTRWQWMLLTLAVSVLSGIGIAKLWMPTPTLALSEDQWRYLNEGRAFEVVWPHLSTADQQRFLKAMQAVGFPAPPSPAVDKNS